MIKKIKITLIILSVSMLFSIGKRDTTPSYTLKLENTFTSIIGWNLKSDWISTPRIIYYGDEVREYKLEKIETYSIKERPNYILLVYFGGSYSLTNPTYMLIERNSISFKEKSLESIEFRIPPNHVKYMTSKYEDPKKYSKEEFIFDYFNNNLGGGQWGPQFGLRKSFFSYYLDGGVTQYIFVTYDMFNSVFLTNEPFGSRMTEKCLVSDYKEFNQSELNSCVYSYMKKHYYETSFDEIKKIFLIE